MTNTINLTSARSLKEFIATANDKILKLENTLYEILETKSLEAAKELAADVLGEDLDVYLEEDSLEELDFENNTYVEEQLELDFEKGTE